MTRKVDVRSLLAAATPAPEIVKIGGVEWPLIEPSPARTLEVIRRFPGSAEALAAMALSFEAPEAKDREELAKEGRRLFIKSMSEEGPAVTGAFMNMSLGGEEDPEAEIALTRLPDATVGPLFAEMLRRCPEGYRGFFHGMAQAAGIPVPAEESLATAEHEDQPAS